MPLNLMDTLSGLAHMTHLYQASQAAQDQHALYQQELQDQATKSTMQDIMNRVALGGMGREVNLGTVQDQMNIPDQTIGQNPGTPPPANTAPPLLQRPPDQQDVTTDDLQNLPTHGTTIPGEQFSYARKPDSSRTVDYQDRNGRKFSYELFTPEEQAARARQRKASDIEADQAAKLEAEQTNRQKYGTPLAPGMASRIGLPEGTKVLPEEWDKIAGRILSATRAPNLRFESMTDDDGNVTVNGYDDRTGELKSTSRIPGAGKSAALTSHVTTDDDGNVTVFSTNKAGQVKGKVDLGQMGKSKTDSQAAIDARFKQNQERETNQFQQSQQRQKQQELDGVQKQENDDHAYAVQLGQQLSDPKISEQDKTKYNAALKATRFKLQSYQSRKASILGATPPPKAIMDKIPEGQSATSPDGHTWHKNDGIVYLIR